MSYTLHAASTHNVEWIGGFLNHQAEAVERFLGDIAELEWHSNGNHGAGDEIYIEGDEENIALLQRKIDELQTDPESFTDEKWGFEGITNGVLANLFQIFIDRYDRGERRWTLDELKAIWKETGSETLTQETFFDAVQNSYQETPPFPAYGQQPMILSWF